MALFSRRQKPADDGSVPDTPAAPDAPVADAAVAQAGPGEDQASGAPVPEVSISVSSYDVLGTARPTPAPPIPSSAVPAAARPARGEAPPAETVAGLAENVLLRDAVDAFADQPDATGLLNVARQLMQGQVYLRVKGDVRALLSAGREVPFAVATRGDEQFAVLFSGARALRAAARADGDSSTSALGQPVQTVLGHVLAGPYAGVVMDSWAGRTSPMLPRVLLQTALDEADPQATLKTLLAAERTPATIAAAVSALEQHRVWIAVNRAEAGEALGVAESRSPDGVRHLSVFSHPLEVAALGRGDRPVPITVAQLARSLAGDAGLAGVLVDPAGPWMRLGREDLAPLMSRAI